MINGRGNNRGSGLGGAKPGCCSRKIGGKAGGRGIAKPAPRPTFGKNTATTRRPGFGTGRGFNRGGGFKR